MQASNWERMRLVALILAGAAIGLSVFDSMNVGFLKMVAGGCLGAAVELLFHLDRRPSGRLRVALGCGGLVFGALWLAWVDTPGTSLISLLVALAAAAAIAWGVLRI
jgi:hypothetical protein